MRYLTVLTAQRSYTMKKLWTNTLVMPILSNAANVSVRCHDYTSVYLFIFRLLVQGTTSEKWNDFTRKRLTTHSAHYRFCLPSKIAVISFKFMLYILLNILLKQFSNWGNNTSQYAIRLYPLPYLQIDSCKTCIQRNASFNKKPVEHQTHVGVCINYSSCTFISCWLHW